MDIGDPKRIIEVEPEPVSRPSEIPDAPVEEPEPAPVRRERTVGPAT